MRSQRVSVVMSVYNGERYLRQAVESILRQSLADFEFIIVNDGSIDATADILTEFTDRDSRVRVIEQANTGLTIALRNGCAQAVGEFIARQDADDWSAPRRLETLMKLLDRCPAAVMASSWGADVDDSGQFADLIQRPSDPEQATHQLLHERCGPPAHGSVMFRRGAFESVGGYRECFYYAQDWDLWLRLAQLGYIAYAPEELYHRRLLPQGISGSQTHWQLQFGELGQLCNAARLRGESDYPFVEKAEELRRKLLSTKSAKFETQRQQAATHYRIGTCLSRRGNAHARQHFWRAVRLDPLHWRSWCRLCVELVSFYKTAPQQNDEFADSR